MSDRFDQFPQYKDPPFDLESPNDPITFYSGRMELHQEASLFVAEMAELTLHWLPTPKLKFEMHGLDDVPELESAWISIKDIPSEYDVLVTSASLSSNGHLCSGFVSGIHDEGNFEDARSVRFQIPNFHNYIGDHVRSSDSSASWLGRIYLSNEEIELTIDQHQRAKGKISDLKIQGGFNLFHSGRIEKIEAHISYEEFSRIRLTLFYFLSFSRGLWTGPVPCIGYRDGEEVWKHLEVPRLSAWKSVSTWFPYNDPRAISSLSKSFWQLDKLLADPLWHFPIRVAINWYIEANLGAGALEGSIVLAQTGLELLAWCYLVEDPATSVESGGKFNKWSAARKIRTLLQELQIPVTIPSEITSLHSNNVGLNMQDGPSAITSVRNAVVHPKLSKRQKLDAIPKRGRFDVKQLALWYLELTLLRLIAYDGVYYRRFISGHISESAATTPWSN